MRKVLWSPHEEGEDGDDGISVGFSTIDNTLQVTKVTSWLVWDRFAAYNWYTIWWNVWSM